MELLAKSDVKNKSETLYEHSILTYKCGMKIIEELPYSKEDRKKLKELLSIPLLFHDIGKAATGFQEALKNNSSWNGNRHEILSAAFLKQFGLSDEQIFAVITHHKDILNLNSKKVLPAEQIEQFDGDAEVLQNMKHQFEDNSDKIKELCSKLFQYLNVKFDYDTKINSGIGISDYWLDGDYNSRYGQMKNVESNKRKLASKLRGILRAADHIASAHIPIIDQIDLKKFKITNYSLRNFQKECSLCDTNMIMSAPTGSGKTEAVLLWAQNNQKENGRLFYVLPYQASINAMHQRLSKIFGAEYIGLLHSNSISYLYNLQNADTDNKISAEKRAMNLAGLAREIYYPIRICTPHQLLRFGLRGSGWEYLYLEFSNSLIIYDEIHAFQPRITGLSLSTAKLLQSIGAKVTFTSATFPEFLKKLIKQNIGNITEITPTNDFDKEILDKKRHIVKLIDGTIIDNIDEIKSKINKNKKVLIIVNHVKTAQQVYEYLKEFNPLLLHSRFTKKDRRLKEELLLSDCKPQVVIATQVIEVSLDIDYEVMYTEPAPIDALIQRFGRINRKGIRPPENVYVVKKQLSKYNLYNKERTQRTLDLLNVIKNPVSENDLVIISNQVYNNGYTEEEMDEFNLGLNNQSLKYFDDNIIAGVSKEWVSEIIENSDGRLEVLPECYLNTYEKLINDGLWIEAKDLFVSVSYNLVRKYLSKMDDINIVSCKYDCQKGLLTDEQLSNFDDID